jgi:hypothetical protein
MAFSVAASSPQGHDHDRRLTEGQSTLESNACSILLSSIRSIEDGTHKFIYPTACDAIDGIVDSTSTLIAARTFSKIGRSDISWEFLRTLFSAQGSNGFLPRFVYLNRTIQDEQGENSVIEGSGWDEFVGPFPGPKLFPAAPKGYVPSSRLENGVLDESTVQIWSSNTITAAPHHATTILEVFYFSNQTMAE